jgi:DNA-binding transcriptional ArsR family regulator
LNDNAAGPSAESAAAVAQLASVFGHPLRIRLITALASNGTGSATTFSEEFGDVSVGDCHYHLTTLRKGGVIELVRTRKVRGAKERVYRLVPRDRWGEKGRLGYLIDAVLLASGSADAGAPVGICQG